MQTKNASAVVLTISYGSSYAALVVLSLQFRLLPRDVAPSSILYYIHSGFPHYLYVRSQVRRMDMSHHRLPIASPFISLCADPRTLYSLFPNHHVAPTSAGPTSRKRAEARSYQHQTQLLPPLGTF